MRGMGEKRNSLSVEGRRGRRGPCQMNGLRRGIAERTMDETRPRSLPTKMTWILVGRGRRGEGEKERKRRRG